MQLKFIIDQQYDTQMIVAMLRNSSKEGFAKQAQQMGVSEKLALEIKHKEPKHFGRELDSFVEQEYQIILPYLEKTRDWYQQSWDEINNHFFQTIKDLTNHPWKHPAYECVVSAFHKGIASWGGNKIVRLWKENPFTMRRITAHELIISHFFAYVREKHPQEKLTDQQTWALAEIAAFAVTGLEERLKKFWPWDRSGYYTNHNYSQLVDLQLALKEPFLQRKTFAEYVEEGIKMIKKVIKIPRDPLNTPEAKYYGG